MEGAKAQSFVECHAVNRRLLILFQHPKVRRMRFARFLNSRACATCDIGTSHKNMSAVQLAGPATKTTSDMAYPSGSVGRYLQRRDEEESSGFDEDLGMETLVFVRIIFSMLFNFILDA